MKQLLITAAALITLAACNTSYEKSASGMVYKIISSGDTTRLLPQTYAKVNIKFSIPEKKDSVLSSTYGSFPFYAPIDTGKQTDYTYMEVLSKCKVGDSASLIISMDTLVSRKLIAPTAPFLVKNGTIQCTMKVLAAFKNDSLVQLDYDKEVEAEKQREQKSAEDYAAKNNLKTQKTKSGALVVIDNPGEGMKGDSGKVVSVRYKGYLQKDGKVFDSNMDSTKGGGQPYDVTVGAHGVIPGWEEAFPFFAKGAKGKIIVPAFLAYGPRQSGPDIPPNSNLVFDIEIVDVKDAPPASQKPAPPMPQVR